MSGPEGKPWTIYVLADPRIANRYMRVGYVGCTTQKIEQRLGNHLSACYSICPNGRPMEDGPKAHWIRDLLEHGVRPVVESVETGIGDGSREAEARWMAYYRQRGAILYNERPATGVRAPNITRPRVVPVISRSIGPNLRALRLAAGLTQDGLAAASGVTRQAIQAIENKRNAGRATTLQAIAAALGTTVNGLIVGDPQRLGETRSNETVA